MQRRQSGQASIAIIGAGDYSDDALAALLNHAGYTTCVAYLPDTSLHPDLILFRPTATRADLERGRALAQQRCHVIVLGFPMAQLVEVLPHARWFNETIDAPSLLHQIARIAPHPDDTDSAASREAGLSDREITAVRYYVEGFSITEVAKKMAVAPSTATTLIVRARTKFAAAGHSADTKIGLLRCAIEHGHVPCPCGE